MVGDRLQQLVPARHVKLARFDRLREQDLQVHLVVGAIDSGRVVDRIGVDAAARQRVLDPPLLRKAEVSALGHHPGAELGTVDTERIVGTIADVSMGLAGRLHERADAAVPEQIDRRPQDRLAQLGGRQRLRGHAQRRSRLL